MTLLGFQSLGRTADELVTATERHLYGSRRGQLNRLDGACIAGASTFTYTFEGGGLTAGAYVEVGNEIMYLWDVNRTTKVATVERAMLGTDQENHADNAIIKVAPRFYRRQILDALRDEIASWPNEIYAVSTATLSAGAGATVVDLEGAYGYSGLRLLDVRRIVSQGGSYPDRRPRVSGVTLQAALDLDTWPSGWTVTWPSGVEAGDYEVAIGSRFRLEYFSTYTDMGEVGLTESMLDIPPLGAVVRLLFPTEVTRTDDAAQGRARLAEEVPPGHASRTAQEMLGWRNARLAEEAKRLISSWGWVER